MREIAPDPKIGDKGGEKRMVLFVLNCFWVIPHDMTLHFHLGVEGVTTELTLKLGYLRCGHYYQLTIVHLTI
jgi:hypothetical protein